MFTTGISNNGIIVINRGDTFYAPLYINSEDIISPEIYFLTALDKVYFAICEPNQDFENGVVRKIYTRANQIIDETNTLFGAVNIVLESIDTKNLLPGTYYYQIKLKIDNGETEILDTIVPKRKLVIC